LIFDQLVDGNAPARRASLIYVHGQAPGKVGVVAAFERTLGRYRLLRLLGEGGVGQVHLACSHGAAGFEKLVALKVLRPELTSDPGQVKCLRDEAHIGVGLEHHNIVQVLDLGEEAGRYYIVMEYIRGFSLAKTLGFLRATDVQFPIEMALHIFRAVSRALDHVHSRTGPGGDDALFHGDVSAANVMMGASGRIALADFGVAALMHQHPEQLAGKWSYVPPEALLGSRVNDQWDLFALGALLYEMLAGSKAFSCNSFSARADLPERCVPVKSLRPEVSQELSDLVDQFLEPVPSDRMRSAKAMRAAVNALEPVGQDDIDNYHLYVRGLFYENDFIRSHGNLPSTTSKLLRGEDPFAEKTETPTAHVRLKKPLRFGLSMAHGAEHAKKYGAQLAESLSAPIERTVRAVLLGDYQTLLDCLLNGDVDIAWMPPVLMAQAVRSGAGVVAVAAREGRQSYFGSIIVRDDSPVQCVQELRGKTMAWVDKDSASGYHFAKALLEKELGAVSESLGRTNFHSSHRAVCEAVANGWADAGATYVVLDDNDSIASSAWGDLVADRASELRMLTTTAPIPGDCIASRPNLSSQWQAEVQRVLCALHKSEQGRTLMEQVFRAECFVVGELDDYEAIHIER
jgi:phosphate/phosphite/phosphonate ABC transporter binding protein